MLPFSILETKRFRDFMAVFDPSFVVPSRPTAKGTVVGKMYESVNAKIKSLLNSMKWVNVSVDGWSDATIRCFNGYIIQGIDSNWKLHTLAVAFQYVTGKHTGKAIKNQFDVVAEQFGKKDKVFKIVADQAANVKKAFSETTEAIDIITIASDLVKRQKKLDLIQKKEEKARLEQDIHQKDLEKSIEEMNQCVSPSKSSKKRTAAEILEDYQDELEEETEDLLDLSNLLDQTQDDVDEDEINLDLLEENDEDEIRLAYEPCAAHNIQLVLKDGFESVPDLNDLVKRLSKNVVSKSKFSSLIAEELRTFGKKFSKRVITRWNSILFTARSLIRVKPEEYKKIREKMPFKTKKEKAARNLFILTHDERETLEELVVVLEWFEWVTDEFQSNKVSISKVYPCVEVLRNHLKVDSNFKHVSEFCEALLASLDKRFGTLVKNEVTLQN